MWSHFIHVQYCYDYLIGQIPVGLLIYSHIPTALLALVFGGYVFFRVRKLSSFTLFIVCVAFACWCFFDLSSWFAFLGSEITMFTWSLVDLFALIFFFFAYYFLYTFNTNKDLPIWQKLGGIALLAPTAYWTFLGSNLLAFDANTCEALEHEQIALYPYYVEGFFILAVLFFAFRAYRKMTDKLAKRELLLSATGVSIFLVFFFTSTLGVNYLINNDVLQYAYNFEIYGLFGMPILLIYLGYLIVRYKAFDLRIFGVQALVVALIGLIGSEFTFVNSLTNRVLVAVTLVLTGVVGLILVRNVKREIEQRQRIEVLARDLQKANDQQVTLIHFITHQIKGFVAKSRNIFSMALEGDFGPVGDELKPMLQAGFDSDTKGAQTIQEILNAANIKSGKVTFTMAPFDLKALIEEIAADLRKAAEAKGLELKLELGDRPMMVTGDKTQLVNAYKNIIDNSIKYTPSGSVTVSLTCDGPLVKFQVSDTGVGITPEDMKNLFTEGGHGKDSAKINVDSTGFGLYIVKNIIDAHKGKVWAESDGAGKGSRFIIELPA